MGLPIFDLDVARQAIVAGVPQRRCWMVGETPFRHDDRGAWPHAVSEWRAWLEHLSEI